MKPFILFVAVTGVGAGGLGFSLGWRAHPVPLATGGETSPRISEDLSPPGKGAAGMKEERSGLISFMGGKNSPKVRALFAGFDRRKPAASQLAVLQKVMVASPADLAEIAKCMVTGEYREVERVAYLERSNRDRALPA